MIHRFKKVVDGLYRGSAPTLSDVLKLQKDLGIKRIVSLDEKAGLNIKNMCDKLGIEQIIIPLNTKLSTIINFLKYDLHDLLLENQPTFVHCLHGKDRTGFVCAMFKCKYYNVSYEDAMTEARSLGFGTGIDKDLKNRYIQIIKSCCSDENHIEDIVENERSNLYDTRYTGMAERSSFSPPLADETRIYPFDNVINPVNIQGDSREILNGKDFVPSVFTVSPTTFSNTDGSYSIFPVNSGGGQ